MVTLIAGLALASTQDAAVHPYQLPYGRPVSVTKGLWDMKSGHKASMADVVAGAKGVRYVLVGESHDNLAHHQFQADVIKALADSGRYVMVGMEMFTRDNQRNVVPFSRGIWSDEEFVAASNWKTQWGFDYALYKPIFDVVKAGGMPLVALNVPRDWVREVGREGPGKIDTARQPWVPELFLGHKPHKDMFTAMMGGHPMTGPQGDNIYAAQVTWDVGMAKSALDAMEDKVSDKWVMVIVAGSGHVMYDAGINYRLKRLGGADSVSVVCVDEAPEGRVSSGIGDFVMVSGG